MGNPIKEIIEGIELNENEKVISVLTSEPEVLHERFIGQSWLHLAASNNNIEIMKILAQKGLDVNDADGENDVPLHSAADNNAIDAAKWLLENGAKVDGVDLESSTPLVAAIVNDDFEMVKLLREHGARLDLTFTKNKNDIKDVMSFARIYGNQDIINYLKGYMGNTTMTHSPDEITGHIEKHIGPVNGLALTEVVGDLQILVVPKAKNITLVTNGMSANPMNVPSGAEEFQYAELMMTLPADWPVTKEALSKPENNWPIDWLRNIANYPFAADTWLGGPYTIISNDDPPQPLGPNTDCTCMLIMAEPDEAGNLYTKDGRHITFYSLFPLYTEERDLEKENGLPYLLMQFQRNLVKTTFQLNRKNVGL